VFVTEGKSPFFLQAILQGGLDSMFVSERGTGGGEFGRCMRGRRALGGILSEEEGGFSGEGLIDHSRG